MTLYNGRTTEVTNIDSMSGRSDWHFFPTLFCSLLSEEKDIQLFFFKFLFDKTKFDVHC
jgi:hypothetical protein